MFTVVSEERNSNHMYNTAVYACLSTDTKPTTRITNGSMAIEMDTGDVYLFDEDNSQWLKFGE